MVAAIRGRKPTVTCPALTVLQLDTHFPRIPGDVASSASYREEIEVIRVPAHVADVVWSAPEDMDIEPFEKALTKAKGDVITTSCGFLAPWQKHLSSLTQRPFLASVLNADPIEDSLILTFDADALGPAHLQGWASPVLGLPRDNHLREVIANNAPHLDLIRAEAEIVGLVHPNLGTRSALVLECTNLPPYAPALHMMTERPVHHILTALEAIRSGLVHPTYLTA